MDTNLSNYRSGKCTNALHGLMVWTAHIYPSVHFAGCLSYYQPPNADIHFSPSTLLSPSPSLHFIPSFVLAPAFLSEQCCGGPAQPHSGWRPGDRVAPFDKVPLSTSWWLLCHGEEMGEKMRGEKRKWRGSTRNLRKKYPQFFLPRSIPFGSIEEQNGTGPLRVSHYYI